MLPEIEPDYWKGQPIDDLPVKETREIIKKLCVAYARERNENSRLMQHLCRSHKTTTEGSQGFVWLLAAAFFLGALVGNYL